MKKNKIKTQTETKKKTTTTKPKKPVRYPEYKGNNLIAIEQVSRDWWWPE